MTDKKTIACERCGSKEDQMLGFTKYPVCIKCIKENHKKVKK